MSKIDELKYFEKFTRDVRSFTGAILLQMPMDDHRGRMAVCFIVRGEACLESIYLLCGSGRAFDARILQRSLVDLLVHMTHTMDENNMNDFWYYTLSKRAKLANQLLGDPAMREGFQPEEVEKLKSVVNEYNHLLSKRGKPSWTKPDAKAVLRDIGLQDVYKFGYDFPSSFFVHPVWSTGRIDLEILGEQRGPYFGAWEVVRHSVEIYLQLTDISIAFYDEGRSSQIPISVGECLTSMLASLREETYGYTGNLEEVLRLPLVPGQD